MSTPALDSVAGEGEGAASILWRRRGRTYEVMLEERGAARVLAFYHAFYAPGAGPTLYEPSADTGVCALLATHTSEPM